MTRRLYRSGESEYLMNGASCRLKDINELFYDTGIGKEGYSIIGQGQIDKILSGKPEERRELFDEAAGIVKFKRRKAVTEKKPVSYTHLKAGSITEPAFLCIHGRTVSLFCENGQSRKKERPVSVSYTHLLCKKSLDKRGKLMMLWKGFQQHLPPRKGEKNTGSFLTLIH